MGVYVCEKCALTHDEAARHPTSLLSRTLSPQVVPTRLETPALAYVRLQVETGLRAAD